MSVDVEAVMFLRQFRMSSDADPTTCWNFRRWVPSVDTKRKPVKSRTVWFHKHTLAETPCN